MAPVRFLSDEWAAALTQAFNEDEQFLDATRKKKAVIGFRVLGAPQGDVDYHIRLDHGATTVTVGVPPDDLDLTLESSYDVSTRIVQGTLTGQAAVMTKQITPDVSRLRLMRYVSILAERHRIESQLDIEF